MKSVYDNRQVDTIVAIDPDVDRNGIACLNIKDKSLDINALAFPQALDFLSSLKSRTDKVIVIIEAGWLNHTHWHNKAGDSHRVIAAKGNSVGRNHEVGRKLAEMCEHWNIPYRIIKPLRKIWNGKDGKITATELQSITGYKGKTNQEGRDAALIAWVYAGFPLKMISA